MNEFVGETLDEIEDAETIRLQPCLPPVWDTAIAAFTLLESDVLLEQRRQQYALLVARL